MFLLICELYGHFGALCEQPTVHSWEQLWVPVLQFKMFIKFQQAWKFNNLCHFKTVCACKYHMHTYVQTHIFKGVQLLCTSDCICVKQCLHVHILICLAASWKHTRVCVHLCILALVKLAYDTIYRKLHAFHVEVACWYYKDLENAKSNYIENIYKSRLKIGASPVFCNAPEAENYFFCKNYCEKTMYIFRTLIVVCL